MGSFLLDKRIVPPGGDICNHARPCRNEKWRYEVLPWLLLFGNDPVEEKYIALLSDFAVLEINGGAIGAFLALATGATIFTCAPKPAISWII